MLRCTDPLLRPFPSKASPPNRRKNSDGAGLLPGEFATARTIMYVRSPRSQSGYHGEAMFLATTFSPPMSLKTMVLTGSP